MNCELYNPKSPKLRTPGYNMNTWTLYEDIKLDQVWVIAKTIYSIGIRLYPNVKSSCKPWSIGKLSFLKVLRGRDLKELRLENCSRSVTEGKVNAFESKSRGSLE